MSKVFSFRFLAALLLGLGITFLVLSGTTQNYFVPAQANDATTKGGAAKQAESAQSAAAGASSDAAKASVAKLVSTQCTCFCKSMSGVVDEGTKTYTECATDCSADKGLGMAVCASDVSQYPSKNLRCFQKGSSACETQNGILDKTQPTECPAGYFYCYPDPNKREPLKLQVSIGEMKTTNDLAEYMGAIYKWLVGASVAIVIVMVMIGGLQYVLASGSGQVQKGKERIKNSIIGMVLLLFSYTILFTVNPNLVKLQVPGLPMVRRIELSTGDDCKTLQDKGYELDFSGAEKCGTIAEVVKDGEGNDVADGMTCNFLDCASSASLCLGDSEPKCLTCAAVAHGNSAGVTASKGVCSAFNTLEFYQPKMTTESKQVVLDTHNHCFFTKDPGLGGDLLGEGVCALAAIDCKEINYCQSYDSIKVMSAGNTVQLRTVNYGENSGISWPTSGLTGSMSQGFGDFNLGGVCSHYPFNDPCRWHRKNEEDSCGIIYFSLTAAAGYPDFLVSDTHCCTSSLVGQTKCFLNPIPGWQTFFEGW